MFILIPGIIQGNPRRWRYPKLKEEREKPTNYPEVRSGTRPHAGSSSTGRSRDEIPLRRIDGSVVLSMHSNRKSKEIHNILPMNQLRITRFYEIGIIDRDSRPYSGFPGSLSRPAQTSMDGRSTGHECHQGSDHGISSASNADCPDRYSPRINEPAEPRRMIHGIPFGIHGSASIERESFLLNSLIPLVLNHQSRPRSLHRNNGVYYKGWTN